VGECLKENMWNSSPKQTMEQSKILEGGIKACPLWQYIKKFHSSLE